MKRRRRLVSVRDGRLSVFSILFLSLFFRKKKNLSHHVLPQRLTAAWIPRGHRASLRAHATLMASSFFFSLSLLCAGDGDMGWGMGRGMKGEVILQMKSPSPSKDRRGLIVPQSLASWQGDKRRQVWDTEAFKKK